jgi:hypothetical protein
VGQLAAGIARLRDDTAALAAMGSAAARLARPEAADGVAALLAELAGGGSPPGGASSRVPELVLADGQDG